MATEINEATLLYSLLEYQASFRDPIFSTLANMDSLTALYKAFKEWNVTLGNISAYPNPANAGEYRTTVELLNRRYVFTATLGGVSLSVTNPSWEEAEQIIKVMRAGLDAVKGSTSAEIAEQSVLHSLHLKPKGKTIKDLTSGFLNSALSTSLDEEARAYGFSIYSGNRIWVVDLSALDPEAVFVRLGRTFSPEATFEEIASEVSSDQEKILDTLKLGIVED